MHASTEASAWPTSSPALCPSPRRGPPPRHARSHQQRIANGRLWAFDSGRNRLSLRLNSPPVGRTTSSMSSTCSSPPNGKRHRWRRCSRYRPPSRNFVGHDCHRRKCSSGSRTRPCGACTAPPAPCTRMECLARTRTDSAIRPATASAERAFRLRRLVRRFEPRRGAGGSMSVGPGPIATVVACIRPAFASPASCGCSTCPASGEGLGHPGGRQPCSRFGGAPTVPAVGTHHPSRPHRSRRGSSIAVGSRAARPSPSSNGPPTRSRNVLCCRYLSRIQAWRMPSIPQRTNSVASSRDRVLGTACRS